MPIRFLKLKPKEPLAFKVDHNLNKWFLYELWMVDFLYLLIKLITCEASLWQSY